METTVLLENVKAKLAEIGYELISLSTKYTKGEHIVEVVVDRVEPIDMDAIVEVSRTLNEYFDEINPFDHPYNLDISSLGAEKPLKVEKLNDYVNSYVHVHLTNPINGENIYEGDLVAVNEETISVSYRIKTRTKVVDITKSNISKIRLAIKF